MKNNQRGLLVATIIALVIFTIVSAFGCFTVRMDLVDVYYIVYQPDNSFGGTISNSFVFILILSVCQIGLLLAKGRGKRMMGIVLSVVAVLTTFFHVNCAILFRGMYFCEITPLGYIAMALSLLIVFLQIYTFKKKIYMVSD